MPTCRSWKTGLEFWKWRPYKVRSLVSNSIYAKMDRNGTPSANQVTSKDEPRCGHAVCTLRVHPPTSPCPSLSAHAETKSQGHCRKWHHEAESLMTDISAMGPIELIKVVYTEKELLSMRSSRCTNPPPPVPPFLLTQNLSPKDIAGSDIMKLKVSWPIYPLWALKS